MTQKTDINNVVESIGYDSLGRRTADTEAYGTSLARKSLTSYDDVNRNVLVTSDLDTNNLTTQVKTHFDDQNRERLRQMTDDDGTLGINVASFYQNTLSGRLKLTTNPYRSSNDATRGWTLTTLDQLGRTISVDTFGTAIPPVPFGQNSSSLGKTTMVYSGITTTITEADNGSGIQVTGSSSTDGLGRLSSVSDGTGTTSYGYDPLGNLTSVTQGLQNRTFSYDGLSRLLSAYNPESGTISYSYDDNGNLLRRTDARGTTATMTYDGQNRVKSKFYSDGTPGVTFTYDTCSKGYLCSVQGASASNYGYNLLGQVTSSSQVTGGATYRFSYGYNLRGDLKSMVYPSGRRLKYTLGGAGRASGAGLYATGVTYAPHGAQTALTMGNGVLEAATYDARLRLTNVTATKGSSLLSLVNAYAANGNVSTQKIAIPGAGTYTQTFGYDNVNRLTAAGESNANTASAAWTHIYNFDAYGNRAVSSSFSENLATPVSLSQYSSTTNRLVQAPDNQALPADAYDLAGNLQSHPRMGQFTYDAENRMKTATVTGGTTNYTYDGEGRRVMAANVDGTTVFVYNANGEMMAEYGGSSPAVSARYLTADGLGSTRMVTDGTGAVTSRHDYEPFREELLSNSNSTLRTTANGFVGQEAIVRQEFTGKERDAETGLDWFEARYIASPQGRFLSPDPENSNAMASDPQSWNMYAYGRNNPLKYVDPTGLSYEICDANGKCSKDQLSDKEFEAEKKNDRSNGEYFTDGKLYHFDSDGKKVSDGTYRQTDVDVDNPYIGGIVAGVRAAGPVNDARVIAGFYGASALGGFALYAGGAFAGELATLGLESGTATEGSSALTSTLQISKHAAERMAERGFTRDMIRATIKNGTRY